KSRLVAEMVAQAGAAGFAVAGGAAPAYGNATPYLAWRAFWRDRLAVPADAPVAAQMAQVAAQIATLAPTRQADTALLGPVLGLPLPLPPALAGLTEKERKEAREALLLACVPGLVERAGRPWLVVLEDGQWFD